MAGPFFAVSSPAIVLDCVKMAEDSPDVIVRLYEAFGGRAENGTVPDTLTLTL